MADTKISLLTAGTAQSADELPVARAGSNFKVTAESLRSYAFDTQNTTSQLLRLYNLSTDASNYERGGLRWTGGVLELFTEALGAGTGRGFRLKSSASVNEICSDNLYLKNSGNSTTGGVLTVFASNVMGFRNAALGDAPLVVFGGNTSSFPALLRSGTALVAKLGDNSAHTFIQGKLSTETSYAAGAITATGFLTLYDVLGVPYKVPCVAA